MRKAIASTAAVSCAITLAAVWSFGAAVLPSKVVLENARVRVTEVTAAPGAMREQGVRETDQIIVFVDDCRYQRTDPATGEKTVRERKAGDVLWHSKGEAAPQLVNAGAKPFRRLVIELK